MLDRVRLGPSDPAVRSEGAMARTILIADDSPASSEGHCARCCDTKRTMTFAPLKMGKEAIDLAIQHRPDLIILDLAMPVLNGLDASRQLKKIMPEVPIILFTQYAGLKRNLFSNGSSLDRIVGKNEAHRLMELIRELIPVWSRATLQTVGRPLPPHPTEGRPSDDAKEAVVKTTAHLRIVAGTWACAPAGRRALGSDC